MPKFVAPLQLSQQTAPATPPSGVTALYATTSGRVTTKRPDGTVGTSVPQLLRPEQALFLATAFPQYTKINGTSFPVTALAYDGAATERAYWKISSFFYGSGNLTCELIWYATSGTTGSVMWETALAAITPDVDTTDVETKAFATVNTVQDSHLGTTAKRLHTATVTMTNLDSLAAGDVTWLRVSRLPADAGDTIAVDVNLVSIRLSYSDT
jgi:hypothetical protein